ncbi:MAG: DUF1273 domain-containing protein [Clostridia bacterium]|nr:DUF1273 domain-containing protein [Clostridia bacterium]
MQTLRCCFAGHGMIRDGDIGQRIINTADILIKQFSVNEFWIGNYGDFDRSAAYAVRSLKKTYDGITLNLIIPYLTQEITRHKDYYKENFDNIIIADIPEKTPKKLYILKANEYMVNNSDFLICYVKLSFGGAVKTLEYAKRKRIKIYNIANTVRH